MFSHVPVHLAGVLVHHPPPLAGVPFCAVLYRLLGLVLGRRRLSPSKYFSFAPNGAAHGCSTATSGATTLIASPKMGLGTRGGEVGGEKSAAAAKFGSWNAMRNLEVIEMISLIGLPLSEEDC